MKTIHHLAAALLISATTSTSLAVPPVLLPAIPNLRITKVLRSGETAWVKIENNGTANAASCTLQAVGIKNGVYTAINVPATGADAFLPLASGGSRWVTVTDPKISSATSPVLYFRIDRFNKVAETKENDNELYFPYGPVG